MQPTDPVAAGDTLPIPLSPDTHRGGGDATGTGEAPPPDDVGAADSGGGGLSEDLLAIAIGWTLMLISLATVAWVEPSGGAGPTEAISRLAPWLAKPGGWVESPVEAFAPSAAESAAIWPGVLGALLVTLVVFAAGAKFLGTRIGRFVPAFLVIFALATFAYLLARQQMVKAYNLEYALWALAVGLLVSNTVGTPGWLRSATRTEFYIKTGLVLLGSEILFGRLLSLGVPGVFVAWVVTPVVLISTFWFGQRVLKIESPSLNMVISSDMSVCGVSAAIASAAACRAKKEELSLAIGLSLSFTVVMMAVMPAIISAVGMDQILGGAWMGGTIDATGAVAAAGAMLGDEALQVAATVKMIQNILIGVVAFFIAVYWVTAIEKRDAGQRPGAGEIWTRFPKFILGFVAASIFCSLIHALVPYGPEWVDASIAGATKTLRGWCFCLAFVCIGLETNFRELGRFLRGGKPLILYVVGQSLNLVLTLAMAYLMFKVVFPNAADGLSP